MKRNLLLIATIIILLVTVNCSKDDNNSSSPTTGIDFTNPNYLEDYTYWIIFEEGELTIHSKLEIQECSLLINGNEIETSWIIEDEWDEYFNWVCYLYSANLSGSVEYSLNINEKEYSGIILIPDSPIVDYPDFNLNSDYTFSWEMDNDSQIQLIWFGAGGDNANDNYQNWQIEGSKRAFTISKSNYSAYLNSPWYWIGIGMESANYLDSDDCLIISSGNGDTLYLNSDGRELTKKQKLLKIIEQIKKISK